MHWEAITAFGTLFTGIVIAVTAVLAMQQLVELRRATQFDGTKRMADQWKDPELRAARQFVLHELNNRMKDADFRSALTTGKGGIDTTAHPEWPVLWYLEELGLYARYQLVYGSAIYDWNAGTIISCWENLQELVDMTRRSSDNPYLWENAELLYKNAKRWAKQYAKKYPKVRPSTGLPYTFED